MDAINDWVPLSDFKTLVAHIMTNGAINKVVFEREKNGANHFLRRITKKWIASPTLFYQWIERNGKK